MTAANPVYDATEVRDWIIGVSDAALSNTDCTGEATTALAGLQTTSQGIIFSVQSSFLAPGTYTPTSVSDFMRVYQTSAAVTKTWFVVVRFDSYVNVIHPLLVHADEISTSTRTGGWATSTSGLTAFTIPNDSYGYGIGVAYLKSASGGAANAVWTKTQPTHGYSTNFLLLGNDINASLGSVSVKTGHGALFQCKFTTTNNQIVNKAATNCSASNPVNQITSFLLPRRDGKHSYVDFSQLTTANGETSTITAYGLGASGDVAATGIIKRDHSINPATLVFGAGSGTSVAIDQTNVGVTYTLAITGSSGGTYTLSYKGETTAAIVKSSTAQSVQSAINALSTVGSNGFTVTGTSPNYTITANTATDVSRASYHGSRGNPAANAFVATNGTATAVLTKTVTGVMGTMPSDTLRLIWNRGPDDCDLYYSNITCGQGPIGEGHDTTIISHSTKYAGERGARVDNFEAVWITFSGSVNANFAMKVCDRPLVMLGDSIFSPSYSGAFLPADFDTTLISAAIGGNGVITDVPGYSTRIPKRYKSNTPGVGDICEMRHVLLGIEGGLNDLSSVTATTEALQAYADALVPEITGIIDDQISHQPTPSEETPDWVNDNISFVVGNYYPTSASPNNWPSRAFGITAYDTACYTEMVERGVIFVDTRAPCIAETWLLGDGLHPQLGAGNGSEKMATFIYKAIASGLITDARFVSASKYALKTGTYIVIVFTGNIDTDFTISANDFACGTAAFSLTVINGSKVILRVESGTEDDTISYSGSTLLDTYGNVVPAFSDETVTAVSASWSTCAIQGARYNAGKLLVWIPAGVVQGLATIETPAGWSAVLPPKPGRVYGRTAIFNSITTTPINWNDFALIELDVSEGAEVTTSPYVTFNAVVGCFALADASGAPIESATLLLRTGTNIYTVDPNSANAAPVAQHPQNSAQVSVYDTFYPDNGTLVYFGALFKYPEQIIFGSDGASIVCSLEAGFDSFSAAYPDMATIPMNIAVTAGSLLDGVIQGYAGVTVTTTEPVEGVVLPEDLRAGNVLTVHTTPYDDNGISQTVEPDVVYWLAAAGYGAFGAIIEGLPYPTKIPPVAATWSNQPTAITDTVITMTAEALGYTKGDEYQFEQTVGGVITLSAWQTSPTCVATGLLANTAYSYRVRYRDYIVPENTGDWSAAVSVTTFIALALPTIAGTHQSVAGTTGSFSCSLSSLSSDTWYNVRAYAINSAGTAYGNVVLFHTSVSP